jgi:flagellar hook assembly protein FlgD
MLYQYMAVLLLSASTASAINFDPAPLIISAPKNMYGLWDGTPLDFPIIISGTPATVVLMISINGKASSIKKVKNGYLGWHYVNGIDTVIFVSPPFSCNIGENTFVWNCKDESGNMVPAGDYTFALWAFDSTSPGLEVTNLLSLRRFDRSHIQTRGENGTPLSRPIIFDSLKSPDPVSEMSKKTREKWVIGGEPTDATLLETTQYTGWYENSRMAIDPVDSRDFYIQSLKFDGYLTTQKRSWVPNGEAILQLNWGNNGEAAYPTALFPDNPLYSGPVSDGGDYLFFTNTWSIETSTKFGIISTNIGDGTVARTLDLTSWWVDVEGQPAGPNSLEISNGKIFCASPQSCLAQMIDPYSVDESDCIRWANGNGDGVADKNFQPGSAHPWVCQDPDSLPYANTLTADSNLFSAVSISGQQGLSFGLFAPDGTGIGNFTLPDIGTVYGMHIVDSGSVYDGIYYGGESFDGKDTGIMYIACDSFFGSINLDLVEPPLIWLLNPDGSDIWKGGSDRYITWNSLNVGAVSIEYTIDGGLEWIAIADNVASSNSFFPARINQYLWNIPMFNSSNCKVRIFDTSNAVLKSESPVFPIFSSTSVSDQSRNPRPFVAVSNHPNPFNPATTIRYELGMPGRVTLSVYNTLGQRVSRLDLGQKERGAHELVFDGTGLTSGVYFYKIDARKASATGRMLLLR